MTFLKIFYQVILCLFGCCSVAKSCLTLLQSHRLACQAPLSIGFPRQEYCIGLQFPSPGDIPDPGIKPEPPALTGGFFTTEPTRKHPVFILLNFKIL